MLIRKTIDRRRVLRGMLGGAAVSVGLPLLDCFLNDAGTAMAGGAPLPVRFGTWFWGLGMNEKIWIPDKVGADYDLKEELLAIKPVKQHINLFTHYKVGMDGRPPLCHYTGWIILRCGQAPIGRGVLPNESIDVTVADAIGGGTRFRSIEMTATGNRNHSYSFRDSSAINPPEVSPLDLYQKVFGADFQDPNSRSFKPNPQVMLRKSALSAVREDSGALYKTLGYADKQRMEQYFTSLRGLEQRLELQLQKPPPALACKVAGELPPDVPAGQDIEIVAERHNLMTDILVAALACNQTRVFNMMYSDSAAATTKKGLTGIHHVITHEEPMGPHGYQENHTIFTRRAMEAWAYFVSALAAVREGDRSLLDNTLVFAHSDHSDARTHGYRGIPMMTAGRAGGRIKSGLHVDGRHEHLATEVGLTLTRAMGLELDSWGKGTMQTQKTIGAVLV